MGRITLFMTAGTDNQVWYLNETKPGGDWGESGNPTQLPSNFSATSLVVGSDDWRREELFGIASDSTVWNMTEASPNKGFQTSVPLHLPTSFQATKLALGHEQDGRLTLFAIGTYNKTGANNRVAYLEQLVAFIGPSIWTGAHWELTDGYAKDLAVGLNGLGMQELFVIGTDNGVWHSYETSPNSSSWTGFGDPSLRLYGNVTSITVAWDNSTQRFKLAATAPGGEVWSRSVSMRTATPWTENNAIAAFLCFGHNPDGSVALYAIGVEGNVYTYG